MIFSFPVIQTSETGVNLRKYRKQSGIRVSVLCELLGGISEQAVYKWERGESVPSIDNLLALSHLYHVSMDDLIAYKEADSASYYFALLKCYYSRSNRICVLTRRACT